MAATTGPHPLPSKSSITDIDVIYQLFTIDNEGNVQRCGPTDQIIIMGSETRLVATQTSFSCDVVFCYGDHWAGMEARFDTIRNNFFDFTRTAGSVLHFSPIGSIEPGNQITIMNGDEFLRDNTGKRTLFVKLTLESGTQMFYGKILYGDGDDGGLTEAEKEKFRLRLRDGWV